MAEAVTPRDAPRLPRQPEQPDRHDLPAPRVGGVPRARCRRDSSSWSPTTRTPTTSRIPSTRTRSRDARRRLGCRRDAAHLLEDLRPRRGCASATASRPVEVIEVLQRIRQPFNVNALALVGGARRARRPRARARGRARCNREGMAYLSRRLRPPRRCRTCRAGRTSSSCGSGRGCAVYDALLRRGVIVRPMDGYGLPEHLRVTVGLPEENERFVEALEAVLARRRDDAARRPAADRRRRPDRRLARAGGPRARAGRRGGRARPQRREPARRARARHRSIASPRDPARRRRGRRPGRAGGAGRRVRRARRALRAARRAGRRCSPTSAA